MDVEADRARYQADRAKDIALAGTHGIDEVMQANRLDALLFPGASGAAIAAKPGYPTVIVPFGHGAECADSAFPGGFQRTAGSFRRQFHGPGVQRAAPDRAGVQIRAGDETAASAAICAVTDISARAAQCEVRRFRPLGSQSSLANR